MGHNKSKLLFEPENLQHIRHLHESKEERKKRRKWRKKQGYSLPTGMDSIGKSLSAASSHTDLPDLDQDDAILVSYSKSNAEKFSHLRPQFQRRASSEEPQNPQPQNFPENSQNSQELVQVIHVNDNIKVTPENTKKTIINLNATENFEKIEDSNKPLDEDEEILNVIQDSFKKCRAENLASPKLEPEDIDLLNALMSHDSLVPEPSVVVLPDNTEAEVIDNKELKNLEAPPPPPSPYASNNTTDVVTDVILQNENEVISPISISNQPNKIQFEDCEGTVSNGPDLVTHLVHDKILLILNFEFSTFGFTKQIVK